MGSLPLFAERPPEDGAQFRQLIIKVIHASSRDSAAEQAEEFRKALSEHPELFRGAAIARGLSVLIREADLPLGENVSEELMERMKGLVVDRLAPLLRPLLEKAKLLGAHPAVASLKDGLKAHAKQALDLLREETLLRFAALPAEQRMALLKLIPDRVFELGANQVNDLIRKHEPTEFPALDALVNPARKLAIEGLSEVASHGFSTLIRGYFARMSLEDRRAILVNVLELPPGASPSQLLAAAFQRSGPTLQKLFQLFGKKSKLEVIKEASRDLMHNIKPFDGSLARQILEQRLGRPLEEVFSYFNEVPLAAASVAQTHEAVLRDTGERVVIKIRRPGIVEKAERELALFESLADDDWSRELVRNLAETLRRELDLRIEAEHIRRGMSYSDPKKGIAVAPVVEGLPVFEDVLIVKRASGKPLTFDGDVATLKLKGKAISGLLEIWFQRALYGDGFFHADLHEGNLFFSQSEEAPGYHLTLIDFGSAGSLTPDERTSFLRLAAASYSGSIQRIMDALEKVTDIPEGIRPRLQAKIEAILRDPAIAGYVRLGKITAAAVEQGAGLPSWLVLFGRGKAFLEHHLAEIDKVLMQHDPKSASLVASIENHYLRASLRGLANGTASLLARRSGTEHTVSVDLLRDMSLSFAEGVMRSTHASATATFDHWCNKLLKLLGERPRATAAVPAR